LQIGHRKSNDLDFVVHEGFDEIFLKQFIRAEGFEALVLNRTSHHTEWLIGSVKVDFMKELVPLRFPLKRIRQSLKGLKMADAKDIGRMKLLAIGSRGSKKDFVDVYCLTRKVISLERLIGMAATEDRRIRFNRLLFLKGLIDFDEADKEEDPVMMWPLSWDEVKDTLRKEVRTIARAIR